VKRSPVLGAATGLAVSIVALAGFAFAPAALSASSAAPTNVTIPSGTAETAETYADANAASLVSDRETDRASRAARAGSAARSLEAALKLIAAQQRASATHAAAVARQRALAHRIVTGDASVAEIRSWTQGAVTARGWSDAQWTCLDKLWTLESNWNYRETNDSSGAYGIPQALPGTKMGTVAGDWRTNIATQVTWGLQYIAGRYGTPCGAWAHSRAHNWY